MVKVERGPGEVRILGYSGKPLQNWIRVFPETVAQGIENALDRPVTTQDMVEKETAIRTLPFEYHPSPYEGVCHLRENTWMQFVKWRMTGEKSQAIEYVPRKESVGIMIPTEAIYRDYTTNIGGLTLPNAYIQTSIKDFPIFLQKHHNFKQNLVDYMRSDEGYGLAESLKKAGFEADDVDYIAIGFLPEKAIYGIGRLPDGEVVIYANKDSYKKIENQAKDFDMEAEELMEAAIGEEMVHLFRQSLATPGIPEERATKQALKAFYEKLYEGTIDESLKEKYSRIIDHLEFDIATVGRYAELYSENSSKLEAILESEAVYKEGINTSKGIREYVSTRLEEIADAVEGYEKGDIDVELSGVEASEGDGKACAEGDGGGE